MYHFYKSHELPAFQAHNISSSLLNITPHRKIFPIKFIRKLLHSCRLYLKFFFFKQRPELYIHRLEMKSTRTFSRINPGQQSYISKIACLHRPGTMSSGLGADTSNVVQGTGILSTSGRCDALVFGGATRMVNLLRRTGGNYETSMKATMFSR